MRCARCMLKYIFPAGSRRRRGHVGGSPRHFCLGGCHARSAGRFLLARGNAEKRIETVAHLFLGTQCCGDHGCLSQGCLSLGEPPGSRYPARRAKPDSNSENMLYDRWTADVKITLGKGFLLIFIIGAVLFALIAAENEKLPYLLRILRIFLGILFVLLAPGYALQAALFPHYEELDLLARTAFSFGLSIAIIPIVLIVLNSIGLGAGFEPIAVSLCLIILAGAGVAFLRQRRIPMEEQSSVALQVDLKGWWASQDSFSRWAYAFLAFAFTVAGVSGFLVSQEAPGEPFTEFYLLDSQGLSMDYPREVTAGTQVFCLLAIVNHEGQPNEYRIVAVGGGDQALSASEPIFLMDGETWQGYLTIVLAQPGDGQKVEFFLERIGSPWPYRTLRIWMNVDPEKESTPGETASLLPADGSWLPGDEETARSLPPVALWLLSVANRVSW